MDTRTKILESSRGVVSGKPVTLVTGYFDVLRAAHIDALEAVWSADRTLVVAVLPHENPVLPQRARAELVAALRMVDYVVTGDNGELAALVSSLQPAQTVRFEDDDRERASELKQHVQRRQSC